MTDSGKPLKPEITHVKGHGLGAQAIVGKRIFESGALLESRPLQRIANKKSQFTFLDELAIYVYFAAII